MKKLEKLNAWSDKNAYASPKTAQGYLGGATEARAAYKFEGAGEASRAGNAGAQDGRKRPKAVSCGIACGTTEDK